jgi:hypothetical protein
MSRRRRKCNGFAAALLALAAALPAHATDLRALLATVADAARAPTPLRATGMLTVGDAMPRDVVLLAHRGAVYVEVRDGGRALVRREKVVVRTGNRVRRAPVGTALAGSDLLLEDLAPFSAQSLRTPQISDEGAGAVVVTAPPAVPSAYSLLVLTIDPSRTAVTRTKCYRDTTTNLVKMLRFDDIAPVADRPRPRTIVAESFHPARTTTLTLDWKPDSTAAVTLATLRAPALLQ